MSGKCVWTAHGDVKGYRLFTHDGCGCVLLARLTLAGAVWERDWALMREHNPAHPEPGITVEVALAKLGL